MRAFALIGLAVMLGGCAGGLSKEECLVADWRAIGYEDGARGAPASAVSSHRQACAKKAGVAPDMREYLAGRDAGLRQYCKPSNGFAVGSNGGRYYGVCTGAEEGAFTTAYQRGEQLFSLESDLARANAALDEADARLADVQNRITHAELALVSPETPNPERLHILADMKAMHEEEERIKASFRPLRAEHRRAQEELADYRAYLASNGPYPGAAQGVLNANY